MSKNNIIRVQKNKDNPYVMINKQCINNNNLSWAAKGLHTYLMSLPNDWTIYVSELIKHTSSGRDHTYTVIRELIKNGYMQRFEYRYKGKIIDSSYVVYETAIDININTLTKGMATIVKVERDENGEYYPVEENDKNIENTTLIPNTENPNTVKSDTVNTKLLNNNNTKIINKINNNIDVDDAPKSHTDKVIELYKSFKLEKRVMPHTLKLLSKYADYFSLDVFEHIFIQASEESVKKKYSYIKTLIETYFDNKVFTKNDLVQYNQKFKDSKSKKATSSNSSTKKVKTKLHNCNETFTKFTPEDLEKHLQEVQKDKFVSNKEFNYSSTDLVDSSSDMNDTNDFVFVPNFKPSFNI